MAKWAYDASIITRYGIKGSIQVGGDTVRDAFNAATSKINSGSTFIIVEKYKNEIIAVAVSDIVAINVKLKHHQLQTGHGDYRDGEPMLWEDFIKESKDSE